MDMTQSDTERQLATILTEVLHCDAFAPEANFLDCGGDSIAAMLCSTQVRRVFGVDLRVSVILDEMQTLRSLAAHIDRRRAEAGLVSSSAAQ